MIEKMNREGGREEGIIDLVMVENTRGEREEEGGTFCCTQACRRKKTCINQKQPSLAQNKQITQALWGKKGRREGGRERSTFLEVASSSAEK